MTKLTFGNRNNTNNNATENTAVEEKPMSAFERMKAKANAKSGSATPKEGEREQVKYWLNIGKEVSYQEENELGELEDKTLFVSLDVPMNLEDIKVKESRSNSEFQQAMNIAKTELLEALLQFAYQIPEGESAIVEDIQVQIRHAGNNTKVKAKAENHPLLSAFRNLK